MDVPDTFTQQFGNQQAGFFVDIIQPVLKTKILDWEDAILNLSLRTDYVDYNIGKFAQTNTDIGADLFALTPALSLRPSPQTVLRIKNRYQCQKNILTILEAELLNRSCCNQHLFFKVISYLSA